MSYRLDRQAGAPIVVPSGRTEIGTSPDCGIVLAGPGVAGRHAILFNVYGRLWIQANGGAIVVVNGTAQQAATLGPGDRLCIGETELTVRQPPGSATLELPVQVPPSDLDSTSVIHSREQQMRGTGLMRRMESGALSMAEMGRYMMAFHRVSELLRSVNDRDAIVHAVVELLRELFFVHSAHYVEQRRGQSIRIISGGGPGGPPPSHSLIQRVLEEQVSYLVSEPRLDLGLPPVSGATPAEDQSAFPNDVSSDSMIIFGIRAAMAAPVPLGSLDVAAALYVDSRDERVKMKHEDLALLEATASYVGAALEKADLYRDLDLRVRAATDEIRTRASELERRNHELRRLQSQREMLVSLLVHDIKAGLSAIRAGAELASESFEKGRHGIVGESMAAVRQGAVRLEAMVGDMLDVSRLEDGALVPRRTPVPLRALLEAVRARWRPAATARRLEFNVEASPALVVQADAALLARVIENLVANAVRFAPLDSAIDLSARAVGEGHVEVCITDRGQGIAASERARLFEKYGRVEGRSTGHGLGLYFCRLAVEAHGGRIEIAGQAGDNRVLFRIAVR